MKENRKLLREVLKDIRHDMTEDTSSAVHLGVEALKRLIEADRSK